MRRISAHFVLTPGGLEPDRVVTVSDEGVIVDVSTVESLDRQAGVEFYPGIVTPGFFNAHCHLELSHLAGAIAPGGGFTEFARGMRRVRGGFPDGRRTAAADFWDAKMWSEGVSRVADVCNGNSTFDLKTGSRVRYHNFCELFGLGAGTGHASALRDRAREMGIEASVTPHSSYSLQREAFAVAASADTAGRESPLSIHFLESEEEIDLFKRRGPLWDWYREQGLAPDFLDYGGPAERLVAQIPPARPVMLVHNTCATQRDVDIVMGHFTAPVTWVLCPGSNLHISGARPPVGLLRKNGLTIAVGTDSLASNGTLSMVRELRLLAAAPAADIPLAELLGWAAADSIAPGHSPGLVRLTGVDPQTLALTESSRAARIV
jgi:cytosine/adenosine deaminase-related metal-dependent hydrolase